MRTIAGRSADLVRWSGWLGGSSEAKEAVGEWALSVDFLPIEEIENVAEGRLDILLIPTGINAPIFTGLRPSAPPWRVDWTERMGLAGVEIKVSKPDFRNGLKEQYERYSRSLSGLYIAGPPEIVKPKDVPPEFGVLSIGKSFETGYRVACRRHPKWVKREIPNASLWRIMWALKNKFEEENSKRRKRLIEIEERFGHKAGTLLAQAVMNAAIKELQ